MCRINFDQVVLLKRHPAARGKRWVPFIRAKALFELSVYRFVYFEQVKCVNGTIIVHIKYLH